MATYSSSGELAAFSAAIGDQYELEREIGRGGMGVVYLARDLRLDRMVAIKTLPPSLAGDDVIRERFLREARTAARLNHPNIVPIHRADEINGQVFFVMGFVDGDSLAAKLVSGALSSRDALPILRDVANALGHAHRLGVVHRDVKTENILLDVASGRAMVTDFGIARVAAAAPLTATGQVLGTVYYLSPEQVTDEGVDARSDIYALGVVGFAMLSGRFPFDGNTASAVLVSHVLRPAPRLESVAPNVPPALAAIIDRCLAKKPEDRFQSCADVVAALDAAQADANASVTTAPRAPTPLVSNTEAQAILGRAAELGQTGARPRPLAPVPRDIAADARRREGFKTGVLREAAAEAGIAPDSVEQALAEHGLRPVPKRARAADLRPTGIVHDLTKRGAIVDPAHVHHEMVFDGEVAPDDYDLLVAIIQRHFTDPGVAGVIGKSLSWKGGSPRQRTLEVQVQPRGGRTTLQVRESFGKVVQSVYAIAVTAGVMVGGSIASAAHAGTDGFAAVAATVIGGVAIAGVIAKGYFERRQRAIRDLTEELGAQVQQSIAYREDDE